MLTKLYASMATRSTESSERRNEVLQHFVRLTDATLTEVTMAQNTIATQVAKGKKGYRGELTQHEIALLAEMYEEVREGRMTVKELAARFA